MKYLCLCFVLLFMQSSFKKSQLENGRVKVAYEEKELTVKNYFEEKGVSFNSFRLFLRAFKREGKLEVWVRNAKDKKYLLLHTYDFCALSGTLGPKRKEGDMQVPEGVYEINHFNPLSNFYLSLGINYPNASDKILSDHKHPGGSIYIHGNCVTVGCIPITDEKIKELYIIAVEAKNNGQEKIPVYIFPDRLEDGLVNKLSSDYHADVTMKNLWRNLEMIYHDFEVTKELHPVTVNNKGEYVLGK
jgi:murein L,D-transpeptidase YafK